MSIYGGDGKIYRKNTRKFFFCDFEGISKNSFAYVHRFFPKLLGEKNLNSVFWPPIESLKVIDIS